jgi:hypothetical protein
MTVQEEFLRKTKYRLMARQYVRDTLLLTGAAYVMEGVEKGTKALRGGAVSWGLWFLRRASLVSASLVVPCC